MLLVYIVNKYAYASCVTHEPSTNAYARDTRGYCYARCLLCLRATRHA